MNCPRCRTPISPGQNSCCNCAFSASFLHNCLGNQWVRLERITDVAQCLSLKESRLIEVCLDDFERRFPQAFFAAYLGILPHNLSVSELGFWLLNQGAFNTRSVSRRNDFGLVMVVDPSAKAVGITLGYALERFFEGRPMRELLRRVGGHLQAGTFGLAIEDACRFCDNVLRKHGHSANWQPEASTLAPDLGLQPLREGHKASSRPLADLSSRPS